MVVYPGKLLARGGAKIGTPICLTLRRSSLCTPPLSSSAPLTVPSGPLPVSRLLSGPLPTIHHERKCPRQPEVPEALASVHNSEARALFLEDYLCFSDCSKLMCSLSETVKGTCFFLRKSRFKNLNSSHRSHLKSLKFW